MSLFSGTRLTERTIELSIHRRVRYIVGRLVRNEIDEPDAVKQLEDFFVKAVNAKARTKTESRDTGEPT